ncbi:MAG: carboxy terminal-processing peptidase [Chthoniobacteraceae bacterium]
MKFSRSFICLLTAATLSLGPATFHAAAEPEPGQIIISVGRLLEQGHYSRRKIDDKLSRELLKNYLDALDYNHLFFTQKDVDALTKKYETSLDDDILLGNPEPAYVIYELYRKRVTERAAKVKTLLKEPFDFKGTRTVEINRQKAPWPKDEAAADQIWRDRTENELLAEQLGKTEKKAIAPGAKDQPIVEKAPKAETDPIERITKRYDRLLRSIGEQTKDDMVKMFLSTLSQTYDPHSEYLSKSELENFAINMRLALVGIGAVLQSDEGLAKIMELVPGGPASRSGEIKVGDRISGVAQGDKEFIDTLDMKLDKVVEMIRGKKDTIVRLRVLPVNATDPSLRKIVEIKRDEIKLKDQEARAELIERPMPDGTTQRLGWIVLPSFYADMEHSGSATAKSTTRDVLALLNRLKQENISGLVIDLRRDGGGALDEAVNLTGLFIKRGPVVQAKDSNGNIHVQRDRDSTIAYDGPLMVLTNKLSASASEIFAAALQDYGRAVIVGDSSTFGKGTVQNMIEIGRVMPFLGGGNDAGALKLTIQKFYRIAGGSTQLKGVLPDVKLPSSTDHPEIGEGALKGPLAYDTVDPVPFERWSGSLFKTDLAERSAVRVAADPEFRYIVEDTALVNKRLADNRLSLNLEKRKAEIEEEKARKDSRKTARAETKPANEKRFIITLDTVTNPKLLPAEEKEKQDAAARKERAKPDDADDEDESDTPEKLVDAVRNETLNILGDLVELNRAKTAAATK